MSNNLKEVEITKLKFPENIRTRQGMFGSDGENASILFREIVDNDVDLTMKNRIDINIVSYTNMSGWNFIQDDGPGMPVYKDPEHEEEQPITIDLLSQINVGSNFKKTQYSAGMNGVGSKLTNALSDDFVVLINTSKKDKSTFTASMREDFDKGNTVYCLHFQKGILVSNIMLSFDKVKHYMGALAPEKLNKALAEIPENFGTVVFFKPDATLLTSIDAYYHGYPFMLIKGLFPYDNDFKNIKVGFSINGKEIDSYDFRNIFKEDKLVEDKVFTQSVSINTEDALPVKFIYQVGWSTDKFNTDADGSVNLLKTPGGKHINIVKSAIARAFHKYNGLITSADSHLGMRLFVLSLAIEPLFNSQDKSRLSKYEDKGFNENDTTTALADSFLKLMKANSEFFDLICARIVEYKKQMNKLGNMELLKANVIMGDEGDKRRSMSGDMARVYEATSRDFTKRELYITEGNSASGKIIEHRNKLFQSVLPLKGKLINTSGFDEAALVDNREILAIINTIGCGMGAITDISKSRYDKVILATDADSDGSHIANLITALFVHHAPDMIKAGKIYKLETPFYRVEVAKGKFEYYYYDQKHEIDFDKYNVVKLKGLGSHNDFSTEKYITNPNSRRLIQLVYNDDNDFEVSEATKLLHSGVARKKLMVDRGVIQG